MAEFCCGSDPQWGAIFRDRMTQERVPLRGMLELTSRCNLKCVHCYLGDQEEQHRQAAGELSTEAVCELIDDLVAAGTLFLTITGGDPMMRKDFIEIYRYACAKGLLISVYCDAILVTDQVLAVFREYPPRRVEVSIYGATPEVYERVTRIKGSFARAMAGIRKLLKADVRVELKTVLMTVNQHELREMNAIADDFGVSFRFDGAIFPCLAQEGDTDPIDLRVSAEDLIRAEMETPGQKDTWVARYKRIQSSPESDALYECQAGQTSYYIDPRGQVSPCLMTTHERYALEGSSFRERWDSDLVKIRQKKKAEESCMTGDSRGACNHCPAFNHLETGDEEVESQYVRDLTRHRRASIIAAIQNEESVHG